MKPKPRCCICEIRNSEFNFREGTSQQRGICDFCLKNKFAGSLEKFQVHVYGSTSGQMAKVKSPAPLPDVIPVPEGEIYIAIADPMIRIKVPGVQQIVVSSPESMEVESYTMLVTP